MTIQPKQRIFGFFCIVVGAGIVYVNESAISHHGVYYLKAALFGPAFVVLGLGLLFFQGYRDERINRGEDISHLRGAKLITPRWWAIVVIAFLAGLGYFLLLTQGYVLLPVGILH